MASPLSLSSSMDARVHSFRRLKAENDLSQLTQAVSADTVAYRFTVHGLLHAVWSGHNQQASSLQSMLNFLWDF